MKRFRVTALPANEGDCLVLSYGEQNDLRHIVIDAGRKGTAAKLTPYLAQEKITRLELLVVTHVDADHIEGMLDFLDTHQEMEIADIWFNGYRHLREGLSAMGPVQGEKLTTRLASRSWNLAFGGAAARVADDGTPVKMPALPGGMVFTILSPNKHKLALLEPVWVEECRKQGLTPGHGVEEEKPKAGLHALGANLAEIAATNTTEDSTEANGSSIAMIAEYGGKRALLGADAHADILCDSLTRLNGGAPVAIDLLKVPHHGSQANVTLGLMKALQCCDFFVSTSGARYKHPDTVAIARLIVGSAGKARLRFNYLQPKTQFWKDRSFIAGEPPYECLFPDGDHGVSIELL
jgi:beta-lactamase superfamily II metal-dependent hydrolase